MHWICIQKWSEGVRLQQLHATCPTSSEAEDAFPISTVTHCSHMHHDVHYIHVGHTNHRQTYRTLTGEQTWYSSKSVEER